MFDIGSENTNESCFVCFCNRASVAAVTNSSPGPAEPYPGGTHGSHEDPEVISSTDIRDRTASVERDTDPGKQRAGEMEGDASEERAEPSSEGGIRSVQEEEDRKDEEIRGSHEQRRHVPGGAWLTQVCAYLRVNLLPEWMRVGKERGRTNGEPGREWEEGIEEEGHC
ncbi:hypothetical protein NDU88_006391 [Pleurodeles waltl]|uniref:Uncharacterized protein n=1 Tax=Pleurodeles waltl TaxID=8319 RepID=A0AAV7UPV6_PLEWA|nr:hypothetical protein NDU88_006391 [Pleurodeles waltl]